ncbi:uncharacterized protein CDV56_106564 [Aspergillus thermomutatus]|uniref:Uncharacterized protein n=1 Tax=Aspergillus thermomutatus TaxID=41047 RepID=A0A397GZL4_ASPTH|nr:uncharacterized protein CDV56_106564 [Aspergillus thermomutatus]RHZ54856.1 hypothetical protein CDV56_106564 [Aspergillus thermomutatus]
MGEQGDQRMGGLEGIHPDEEWADELEAMIDQSLRDGVENVNIQRGASIVIAKLNSEELLKDAIALEPIYYPYTLE